MGRKDRKEDLTPWHLATSGEGLSGNAVAVRCNLDSVHDCACKLSCVPIRAHAVDRVAAAARAWQKRTRPMEALRLHGGGGVRPGRSPGPDRHYLPHQPGVSLPMPD